MGNTKTSSYGNRYGNYYNCTPGVRSGSLAEPNASSKSNYSNTTLRHLKKQTGFVFRGLVLSCRISAMIVL